MEEVGIAATDRVDYRIVKTGIGNRECKQTQNIFGKVLTVERVPQQV